MTAVLGIVIAFIAKDLAIPMLGVSLFGLFDRLMRLPFVVARGK